MARYLLIEFDDNDSADRLRAQIDSASATGKGFRVAGLFAPPTKWCECPNPTGYHQNEVAHSSKLGWYFHRVCKRARKGSHQLVNLIKPHERSYSKESGWILLASTISIFEVPVQNIKRSK